MPVPTVRFAVAADRATPMDTATVPSVGRVRVAHGSEQAASVKPVSTQRPGRRADGVRSRYTDTTTRVYTRARSESQPSQTESVTRKFACRQ